MKYIKAIPFIFAILAVMLLFSCTDSAPQAAEPTATFLPLPEVEQVGEQVEEAEEPATAVAELIPDATAVDPTLAGPNSTVEEPYPAPALTEVWPTSAYPAPPKSTREPSNPLPTPAGTATLLSNFLPVVSDSDATPTPEAMPDIATETPAPTNTPTPTPTPIVTLDFAAIEAEMNGRGVEMATAKIGFHVGPGGNRNGLGEYMRRLDEAGVPFFLKSVSDGDALFEAQELMKKSGVPHVLVYRWADTGYDVPDYTLPPAAAARKHWDIHMEKWPDKLDPNLVWLETINEVDKERSEWLAEFSLETAALAEANGFKWAAFGWSSGEPEVSHWQGPKMQEFLRLAASKPDKLAIALHEYSYRRNSIEVDAPYLVGRFQSLFEVTDGMGIARPTILITEWGWTYEEVPNVNLALEHIDWANRLYAPYPEVKGAAIWYLGPGYDNIAGEAQKLIMPIMGYSLTNVFER
ncbi:MAG: hypothetical protein AB8G95_23315 [Anaerolineae bacterium]